MPPISIIVPVFNRAHTIRRTLDSCLRQTDRDWEAIVVDDASTDDSIDIISSIRDPRIRLMRHDVNQGAGPARNTGARAASGEWIAFLDSDDELVPDALEVIRARANAAPTSLGKMLFACRHDDGTISPTPPFDGRRLAYHDYLRWLARMHLKPSEAMPVARRLPFLEIPYPDCQPLAEGESTDELRPRPGRWGPEGLHNLDFAKRYDTIGYPDIVRLYHADAPNRLMDATKTADSLLEQASNVAWVFNTMLDRHGDAIHEIAPELHYAYLRSAALFNLLAGSRAKGVTQLASLIKQRPRDLKTLALLASAWLPRRTLARLRTRMAA